MIHKVTKEIQFCYGHRLLNYDGKCRHLHGHNGTVQIEVQSKNLDSRGIVLDFGEITKIIKTWIDQELDHKMLLCAADPLLKVLQDLREPCFVMEKNPTAENIANLIYDYALSQAVAVSEVRLWESTHSFVSCRRDS